MLFFEADLRVVLAVTPDKRLVGIVAEIDAYSPGDVLHELIAEVAAGEQCHRHFEPADQVLGASRAEAALVDVAVAGVDLEVVSEVVGGVRLTEEVVVVERDRLTVHEVRHVEAFVAR